MSRYFIDCEFVEGTQAKKFLGFEYGRTKPTIDLISIGIVREDGREYYAISKDFNLDEAWNRYDLLEANTSKNHGMNGIKAYWLRDNVLKPIFAELDNLKRNSNSSVHLLPYTKCKKLLKKYGKSNKQIAEEIQAFVYHTGWEVDPPVHAHKLKEKGDIEFYAYFADYDWVAFCWLFGRMIDLPKGFPMFAFDIQQQIEEYKIDKELLLKEVPQINSHNALADARWNKKLYEFLKSL